MTVDSSVVRQNANSLAAFLILAPGNIAFSFMYCTYIYIYIYI